MDSPLVVSLVISVIGMTLLFLTLLLFYFLIVLLGSVSGEQPPVGEPRVPPESGSATFEEERLQAAVLGVSLARAETQSGPAPGRSAPRGGPSGPQRSSPWWDLHHARRLSPSARPRRSV
jgi:Na+-transporting methylmalonyl-CoA/oxaloacetate decarboxylase gamma subunit